MAYSKVIKPVIKIKRVNAMPLIGGAGEIQDLGYIEKKVHMFFWISTGVFLTLPFQKHINQRLVDDRYF